MKYILILLLSLSSLSKADAQYNRIDFRYTDAAFVAGYLSASIYDLGAKKDTYKYQDGTITLSNARCVAWKMGLGLLAGLAVSISHANLENSAIPFEDLVFGGIGGLTCTVIHF